MRTFDELLAEGRLESDVPLGPLSTYRRGGPARWFLRAESPDDLRIVVPDDVAVVSDSVARTTQASGNGSKSRATYKIDRNHQVVHHQYHVGDGSLTRCLDFGHHGG